MSDRIRKQVKTTRPNKKGYLRTWYVLDASKESLGRLATKAANLLTGKNRADYSKDVDMGGMLVVINANKTQLTGNKVKKKIYFRHTGRVGRLFTRTFEQQQKLDPKVPIYKAIKGMLPRNKHTDIFMNQRVYIFPQDHNITHKLTEAN